MKIQTLAFILGGAFVVCGGAAGLAACSSDPVPSTGGDVPEPKPDGSVPRDGSTPGSDAGPTPGTDTGSPNPVGDAGPDCGDPSRNPKLRPSADAGIFCPFQERDAGLPLACAVGNHCCVYTVQQNTPSTCNNAATACLFPDAGTTDWQCGETADCPSGSVCCFGGEPVVATDCPGKNFARGAKGTTCRTGTTCNADEYKVCASPAECPSGKTCTPFATKSIDLGACL